MLYTVVIEAKGYGSPLDEGERLSAKLPESEPDVMSVTLGVDEDREMIATTITFNADHGLDAHEQAFDIWRDAWEQAFPDLGMPMDFSVTARPGGELAQAEARQLTEEEQEQSELDEDLADIASDR